MSTIDPLPSNSGLFKPIQFSSKLKINEIKIPNSKSLSVHPLLPQPPFFLSVVAPRKSGKTNLVLDSLLDKNKYKGVFNEIYIWSQTFHLDPKWGKINIDKKKIFSEWNPSECSETIKEIEAEFEEDNTIQTLIIYDDMIDAKVMQPNGFGCIEGLAVRGRHSNISVIMISQQYMALSPAIRNNTTNLVVFRIRNNDELQKLRKENQESLTVEEFHDIYNFATKTPYSFLHINNQEVEPRLRFRKNWDTIIILNNDKKN